MLRRADGSLPVYEYAHADGNCSITGGYRARGADPEMHGLYFFGDYCTGSIWSLDPSTFLETDRTPELAPPPGPPPFELVSFGEGGHGELYIVYAGGRIDRIRSDAPDADDDYAPDAVDNCPQDANPGQEDADADGVGDACDLPCDDGLDNDADGAFDFPADPGCRDADWRREDPACEDGVDNDGDGLVDWDGAGLGAADPHCMGLAYRKTEEPMKKGCGIGAEAGVVLAGLVCARARRRGREGNLV